MSSARIRAAIAYCLDLADSRGFPVTVINANRWDTVTVHLGDEIDATQIDGTAADLGWPQVGEVGSNYYGRHGRAELGDQLVKVRLIVHRPVPSENMKAGALVPAGR